MDDQGKKSLNFQITVTIALIACIPLVCVFIGVVLIIGITSLVAIIAAVKANDGEYYRYLWTLHLIK